MKTPYHYQKPVIEYLKNRANSACFLEMRLGKSLCVIRALKNQPGRKLVVCPKSVIETWKEELNEEGIISDGFSSEGLGKRIWIPMYFISSPYWWVCNYEAAMRIPERWLKQIDTVIIDESTAIKNPKAQLTKFFLNNFDHTNKIILSGNPAPNHELEYVPQMLFLYKTWLGCKNYWEVRGKYFQSDWMKYNWWIKPKFKDVFKQQLHKDAYILTRKDVGVENKKVYEKRLVEMPKPLRCHYNEMEKMFLTSLPSGEEIETQSVLAKLNYLSQIAGGHLKNQQFSNFKLKELENLLIGELKGEKLIIWAAYLVEVDEILKLLEKLKINACEITGRNPTMRDVIRKRFQEYDELDILVIQASTGSLGLKLDKADTCIYYSNTNSIQDRDQSEARIQANWKKHPLLFLDLVTANSIDVDKLTVLKRKKKQSSFYLEMVGGMCERTKV